MRTSAAALELDFTEPSITAAKAICAVLRQGDGLDRPGLLRTMETAYGSTAADGHWSFRDAYDVLELGQVLHLATLDLPQEPAECLTALTALTVSLPTHTVRSEEQIALQQFSTPAAIGYLAALAARITAADMSLRTLGCIDFVLLQGLDQQSDNFQPIRLRHIARWRARLRFGRPPLEDIDEPAFLIAGHPCKRSFPRLIEATRARHM